MIPSGITRQRYIFQVGLVISGQSGLRHDPIDNNPPVLQISSGIDYKLAFRIALYFRRNTTPIFQISGGIVRQLAIEFNMIPSTIIFQCYEFQVGFLISRQPEVHHVSIKNNTPVLQISAGILNKLASSSST